MTQTTDKLALAVTDLEPASAASLRAAFGEMLAQAEEWASKAKDIQVTRADQTSEMELARESRLALRSIRIRVENKRKDLKEDSLRRGQAIDGIAKMIRALIEPIEAHLLEQEEFVERQEAAKAAERKRLRVAALAPYGVDPSVYADIGGMGDGAWDMLLNGVRLHHEAALATQKAERESQERARLAKEAEDAKVRAENAKLKKEADEQELAAKVERQKLEAKNKQERLAREAAERALADSKAADARRIAAEKAAEIRKAEDRKAEEREAAQAPDREKLLVLAAAIRAVRVPKMKTERGRGAAVHVECELEKLAQWAESALKKR